MAAKSIKDIMNTQFEAVEPSENLAKVFEELKQSPSGLIVAEEDKLQGIITEASILEKTADYLLTMKGDDPAVPSGDLNAAGVMLAEVITVPTDAALETVAILLLENNQPLIPVVNDDQSLAGVLGLKDLLKVLAYQS